MTIPLLLLAESVALLGQAVAAALSRRGAETWGLVFSFVAVAIAFAWPFGVLVTPRLTRAARTVAALSLGVVSTLQWRATDPLLFTGFDEQLHVRTLVDITASHRLGQLNPLLEISPHYPGLEAVAAVFEQLGLPTMAAATITILLARIALVLVLSRAVEDLTGSVRAAGLAVAVYATSQQFFFFNSQFAYQTLAVPLAVTAIACIVRARRSANPRPAMCGAGISILAVAVTHHVTSLLLTALLLVWAIGSGRRRGAGWLWLAAIVSVASMAAWSATQWSALVQYFGPVIQMFLTELHGSGQRRHAFADPSGVTTPVWERLLILYYAGLTSLLTVWVTLPRLRDTRLARLVLPRQGNTRLARFVRPPTGGTRTSLLLVVLALTVPLTFVARSLPQVGELSNRGTTFLFLPLAALVGIAYIRARGHGMRLGRIARYTVVLLATLMYLGGVVLGNGPDWQRLPGAWLASAENRSMDTETLAAVQWAKEDLAPGTRIAADRISGDLLSGQARLWVVSKEGQADAASLYFADTWGNDQLQTVRQLHLQYLYVDERLATQLPHVGVYFHAGETPAPQKLTRAQLTKWDDVLGIAVAYRHGPVTIYDLSGLNVAPRATGWTADVAPPGLPVQIGIGLALAAVALGIRRAAWSAALRRRLHDFWSACGPALSSGVALSALCVLSVTALLAHLWTGPATFATLALVVLLGHGRQILPALVRLRGRPGFRRPDARVMALLALAIGVATIATVLAVESARLADVTAVAQILGHASTKGGGA